MMVSRVDANVTKGCEERGCFESTKGKEQKRVQTDFKNQKKANGEFFVQEED